jgi:hypothetical protein
MNRGISVDAAIGGGRERTEAFGEYIWCSEIEAAVPLMDWSGAPGDRQETSFTVKE